MDADLDGLDLEGLEKLQAALYRRRDTLYDEENLRLGRATAPGLVGRVFRQYHEEYPEDRPAHYVADDTYLRVLSATEQGKVRVLEFSYLKDAADYPEPLAQVCLGFYDGSDFRNGPSDYFHYEEVSHDDPGFVAAQEAIWARLREAMKS